MSAVIFVGKTISINSYKMYLMAGFILSMYLRKMQGVAFERKQKQFCKALTSIEAHLCKLNCPQNRHPCVIVHWFKIHLSKSEGKKTETNTGQILSKWTSCPRGCFSSYTEDQTPVSHRHTLHQAKPQPSIYFVTGFSGTGLH